MLVSSERKLLSTNIRISFFSQWFLGFFSLRNVISHKDFAADTSRNTSSIDRQNWLYSKQLHVAVEMEIHTQKQIAQAEKQLHRRSESCHINWWVPVKKQTNPEKEKSDFWSENSFNTGEKGQRKLKKNFIFTVKHERVLQSKKGIIEMWQFIFCLITHLLVTELAMWSLRQEFILKILWRQKIFSWISNPWSQQYHNTLFKYTKISHHYTIKWYSQTWH